MSNRYVQDRALTQKHLVILKELLKRPENKLCADCKRNDPRWASVSLGLFMCIRCSGIHRSLGVHITRIKSVDLDTWTPEQISVVQRWGNKRANAYWEAHLKQGHIPPDHKMESFIRSKYETKRWAMEGPVPEPETLDSDAEEAVRRASPIPSPPTNEVWRRPAPASQSASPVPAPSRKAAASTSIDLLSAPPSSSTSTSRAPATAPVPPKSAAAKPKEATLFNLDFDSPAPPVPAVAASTAGAPALSQPAAVPQPAKRDAKADILSLFAAAPPLRPQVQQTHPHASQPSLGGAGSAGVAGVTGGVAGLSFGGASNDPWGAPQSAPPVQSGGGGFGGFEGFQSGPSSAAPAASSTSDPWGASSSSVWGNPSSTSTSSAPAHAPPHAQPSKPDPFAEFGAFTSSGGGSGVGGNDIWGSSTSGGGGSKSAGGGSGGFSDIWG
ncbi:hypothetical protein JCM11641_003194 [Rhodosporidiobolus odoratus]